MTEDERSDRVWKRHGGDDVGADLWVSLDLLEFLRCQRPRLGENVIRHRELADVVQQCSGLDRLHLELVHPELTRNSSGVDLNAANMVFRRAVLRIDQIG